MLSFDRDALLTRSSRGHGKLCQLHCEVRGNPNGYEPVQAAPKPIQTHHLQSDRRGSGRGRRQRRVGGLDECRNNRQWLRRQTHRRALRSEERGILPADEYCALVEPAGTCRSYRSAGSDWRYRAGWSERSHWRAWPAGATGATGPAGPQGPAGTSGPIAGYVALQQTVTVPANSVDFVAQIACEAGKVALGGGYARASGSSLTVNDSYPMYTLVIGGSDFASGWTALVTNPAATSSTVNMRVICASQ